MRPKAKSTAVTSQKLRANNLIVLVEFDLTHFPSNNFDLKLSVVYTHSTVHSVILMF